MNFKRKSLYLPSTNILIETHSHGHRNSKGICDRKWAVSGASVRGSVRSGWLVGVVWRILVENADPLHANI
jgi:hypothetical protein